MDLKLRTQRIEPAGIDGTAETLAQACRQVVIALCLAHRDPQHLLER